MFPRLIYVAPNDHDHGGVHCNEVSRWWGLSASAYHLAYSTDSLPYLQPEISTATTYTHALPTARSSSFPSRLGTVPLRRYRPTRLWRDIYRWRRAPPSIQTYDVMANPRRGHFDERTIPLWYRGISMCSHHLPATSSPHQDHHHDRIGPGESNIATWTLDVGGGCEITGRLQR